MYVLCFTTCIPYGAGAPGLTRAQRERMDLNKKEARQRRLVKEEQRQRMLRNRWVAPSSCFA